jgi:hypothetical protein
MTSSEYNRYLLAGCVLLVAATIAVYYPGLASNFLLDDANNLGGLALVPEQGILNYILSGFAGPSGRPLSLLSFALQYTAWPHNPFAFKVVNLAIHLLCGGLIFLICSKFAQYINFGHRDSLLFSLFVTAVWLLHPMQLTTVLYVVQRMTQLASLFMLLGIFLYLHWRERYLQQQRQWYLVLMGLAVWVCTALAVLGKEMGVLLPLLILVINITLLSGQAQTPALKKWHWIMLGLPLLAVMVYLLLTFGNTVSSYSFRPYNMVERLLTQSVILIEYLRNIILPYPGAFSLYRDSFPISRGLLTPPATLVSVAIILLLLVIAVVSRKKWQILSFSLLWFFAGHLLESTHLNLELYFEHRNYLPTFGIFVLIGYSLVTLLRRLDRRWPAHAAIFAFSTMVLINTLMQMRLWADPLQQHIAMVNHHPDSVRSIIGLGNQYIVHNKLAKAEQLYRQIAAEYPDEIYPQLKLFAIKGCVSGQSITVDEWQVLMQMASTANKPVFGIVEELVTLIAAVTENDCASIDARNLTRLVVTLAMNPALSGDRAALHELAARLGIMIGDAGVAYHNILEAVRLWPTVPRQILKVRILLALGKTEEAEQAMIMLANTINGSVRFKLAYAGILSSLEAEVRHAKAPIQLDIQ